MYLHCIFYYIDWCCIDIDFFSRIDFFFINTADKRQRSKSNRFELFYGTIHTLTHVHIHTHTHVDATNWVQNWNWIICGVGSHSWSSCASLKECNRELVECAWPPVCECVYVWKQCHQGATDFFSYSRLLRPRWLHKKMQESRGAGEKGSRARLCVCACDFFLS